MIIEKKEKRNDKKPNKILSNFSLTDKIIQLVQLPSFITAFDDFTH